MALLKRGGLRLVDTFAFATTRQTMKIQVPARFMQRLWIHLSGTLTISAVTVPGQPQRDGPANLIKTLELLQDGKTLKFGSGGSFLRLGQKYDDTLGDNSGIPSGVAGAFPFECSFPIYFEAPSSVSPVDTLIDGRLVEVLTFNLTWGVAADLMNGNTSTLVLSGVTAEVYMEDTEPFPTKGPFWSMREIETVYPMLATSTQFRAPIAFQPGAILRAIQLRTTDAAAPGPTTDLSNAIINALSLRINGEETPFNTLAGRFFQAWSMYKFGSSIEPVGYYHVELAENGKVAMTGLGAKLSGQAVNDVDMILNTTIGGGTTFVVAHTVEHVPPGQL